MSEWKIIYNYEFNDIYGDRTKINCAGYLLWQWD